MNSTQVSAFLAAGGVDVDSVRVLIISLLCAFSFLWAAKVMRDLGMHTLYGHMQPTTLVVYMVRVLIVVMLIVAVVS